MRNMRFLCFCIFFFTLETCVPQIHIRSNLDSICREVLNLYTLIVKYYFFGCIFHKNFLYMQFLIKNPSLSILLIHAIMLACLFLQKVTPEQWRQQNNKTMTKIKHSIQILIIFRPLISDHVEIKF